ncbi:hypothetical protein F0562_017841 [Nyssa sinensis]|uniref:Uncharacterized protein n=1 Tax=Nyssa sinensis TaxID=561372 RepID=A0A5J4ZHH1_9ASTE|nr:hypothetical protein F0562_017841 [Nyssa sinensis]
MGKYSSSVTVAGEGDQSCWIVAENMLIQNSARRRLASHCDSDYRLVGVVRPSSFVFISVLISVQLGSDLVGFGPDHVKIEKRVGI